MMDKDLIELMMQIIALMVLLVVVLTGFVVGHWFYAQMFT